MSRKRQVKSSKPNLAEEFAVPVNEIETPAALLNDIVLENLFKYLAYKDLKSCRESGNTVWLRNSKKAWWSRTKVTLMKENVEKYLNETAINSFAKNYEFSVFGAGDYIGIWERFGHSMKHLKLDCCKLNSVEDFRQIIYINCPNLEKLVVSLLEIKAHPEAVEPMEWRNPQYGEQKNLKFLKLSFADHMPLSWMELLSHFPNLEALECRSAVDVYKVISIIRKHDPKMLKLKHIDTCNLHRSNCEESLRLVLLDPNLSFETIRIQYESCQPGTLLDILNLHAKSLKELSLSRSTYSTPISEPIQMPLRQPLLNLEKLSLIRCPHIVDIFRHTPNVRKIHIIFCETHNFPKTADSHLRIDACKELTIDPDRPGKPYGVHYDSDLAFCLNAFPNVEIFEIDELNNSQFSMICEHWTKLVSVRVHFNSEVDDFGLLGFDPISGTETVRSPNITDLKALQIFTMQSGFEREGRIEMKNGQVVLRELEKLPHLKDFILVGYEMKGLKEKQDWKKIFTKYSGYQRI